MILKTSGEERDLKLLTEVGASTYIPTASQWIEIHTASDMSYGTGINDLDKRKSALAVPDHLKTYFKGCTGNHVLTWMMNPSNGAFQFGTIDEPTAMLLALVVSATDFKEAGDTGNKKERGQADTFGDKTKSLPHIGRQKEDIDKSDEQKNAFSLFFDVVRHCIENLGDGTKFGAHQIH